MLADRPELAHAILAKLWTQGLGVTKLFVRAIHQYPNLAHLNTFLPQAESFAQRCLSISNSAWLDDDEFEKIYSIIENTIHSYQK